MVKILSGLGLASFCLTVSSVTAQNNHPYVASIQARNRNGRDMHVCSGALISKNHVLTAAHCVAEAEVNQLTVKFALSSQVDLSTVTPIERSLSSITVNPNYDPVGKLGNLAVLQLDSEITAIEPVAPPSVTPPLLPFNPEGDTGTIVGWNVVRRQLPISSTVVTTMSRSDCAKSHHTLANSVSRNTMCVQKSSDGKNCDVDPGSPFVKDGKLYGIMSVGEDRCATHSVYELVEGTRSFLESAMGSNVFITLPPFLDALPYVPPLPPGIGDSRTRTRKEANGVLKDEWDKLAAAINTLQQNGEWQNFVNMHVTHFESAIHTRSADNIGHQFLPWHRVFLFEMEKKLREVDPTISIPYVDWSLHAAQPMDAKVWVQFGGWGIPEDNHCVRGEPFGHWEPCIRRSSEYIGTGVDVTEMATTIGGPELYGDFLAFSLRVEQFVHNFVHSRIGGYVSGPAGHMASTNSPYDPLFFLHHCYIDRLWSEWQGLDSRNMMAYSGDVNEAVIGFPDYKISDTFNFRPFRRLQGGKGGKDVDTRKLADAGEYSEYCGPDCQVVTKLRLYLSKKDQTALDKVERTCPPPSKVHHKDSKFWSDATSAEIDKMAARYKGAQPKPEEGNTCVKFDSLPRP